MCSRHVTAHRIQCAPSCELWWDGSGTATFAINHYNRYQSLSSFVGSVIAPVIFTTFVIFSNTHYQCFSAMRSLSCFMFLISFPPRFVVFPLASYLIHNALSSLSKYCFFLDLAKRTQTTHTQRLAKRKMSFSYFDPNVNGNSVLHCFPSLTFLFVASFSY